MGADRLFDKIDAHRRQFAAAFCAGGGVPGPVDVDTDAGAVA